MTLHEHAVKVDTHIAETYRQWQLACIRVESAHVAVRRSAGQHSNHQGQWSGTYAEAVEQADTIAKRPANTYIEWDARRALDEAAEADAVRHEAYTAYEAAEKAYGGWSRFFLVTGGHIHSTRYCTTCYPTTSFGWLPQLSGLTEVEAVEVYGAVLCSICYPSAPVEYVGGKSDGLTLAERAARKAEKDAEKAARAAAKSAKTLNPEHVFVGVNTWGKVTTVAGAKAELREAAALIAGYGYSHQRVGAPATRVAARIALTAKGLTDADLDTIEVRAVKSARKSW